MDQDKLKQLLAQRQEIDTQIQQQMQERRSSAISQIKAIMVENNLTLHDLIGSGLPKQKAASGSSGAHPSIKPSDGKKRPHATAGIKVAAKYLDPATGNSWSGRGLAPRWLTEKEAQGHSRDEFLIRK